MILNIYRRVLHNLGCQPVLFEVPAEALEQFMEANLRNQVTDFFRGLGFRFVALDLEGYAMGSLNRELAAKEGHQNG